MAQLGPAPVRHRGHSRPEGLQPECLDVDPAAYRRIGGVQHLEATVHQEAVDAVGADPAARGVTGLQHQDVETRLGQHAGAPEAGQPCPHHDDLGVHRSNLASAPPGPRRQRAACSRHAATGTPDRIRTGATALRVRPTERGSWLRIYEHAGQRTFRPLTTVGYVGLQLVLSRPQCGPRQRSGPPLVAVWRAASRIVDVDRHRSGSPVSGWAPGQLLAAPLAGTPGRSSPPGAAEVWAYWGGGPVGRRFRGRCWR